MIVGLTGSIGTGKSTVAKMFADLGAVVIDYDQLAREVVEPGREAYQEIVAAFGPGILAPDGTLDRKRLGDTVFGDRGKLKTLNGIVHPRVFAADVEKTRAVLSADPRAVVVKEIPLLTQIGIDPKSLVDRVVVVSAHRENQVCRVVGRGFNQEEAVCRVDAQPPVSEAEKHADYVIRNNGGLEETRKQVEEVYGRLKEEARGRAGGSQ
ncbi:MAG: dephospho-CoA kinase [Proteobacteria bacterium]|nr:dephospho-CoA kinase [Pseudomonadota bacterium]